MRRQSPTIPLHPAPRRGIWRYHSEARIIEPALTTMDVPRIYIGQTAAKLLIEQIDSRAMHTSKVEIATHMIKRLSHCSLES